MYRWTSPAASTSLGTNNVRWLLQRNRLCKHHFYRHEANLWPLFSTWVATSAHRSHYRLWRKNLLMFQPVYFTSLLWLKVLFASLLWEKNTAGWLLIWLICWNEQGGPQHLTHPLRWHTSRTTWRTMKTQSNSAYILLSSEKHGIFLECPTRAVAH
jgi:hypothetical protein